MNGLYFALLVLWAVGYALVPYIHGPEPKPKERDPRDWGWDE